MRILIFSFVLFASIWAHATEPAIVQLRSLFYDASYDEKNASLFYESVESLDPSKYKVQAYLGMTYFLKARYGMNPLDKWNNFKKGRDLLEESIKENGFDAELRFLRLLIQHQTPLLLNYKDKVEADVDFLKKNLNGITDKDLKIKISEFLTKNEFI